MGRLGFLSEFLLDRFSGFRFRIRFTGPDENAAVFINCQAFRVNEFFLEVLDKVIIETKLPFEHPIRHAPFTLEQFRVCPTFYTPCGLAI